VAALQNVLYRFRSAVLAAKDDPESWAPLYEHLSGDLWVELDRNLIALLEAAGANLASEDLRQMRLYMQRLRHLVDAGRREVEMFLPWLVLFQEPPPGLSAPGSELQLAWEQLRKALPATVRLMDVREVAGLGKQRLDGLQQAIERSNLLPEQRQAACDWCANLAERLDSAGMTARVLQIGYERLARQAEAYAQGDGFQLPVRPQRGSFTLAINRGRGQARQQLSTTCWLPRRASPAWWRSQSAMCPAVTGCTWPVP
jgi:hypothetical protein